MVKFLPPPKVIPPALLEYGPAQKEILDYLHKQRFNAKIENDHIVIEHSQAQDAYTRMQRHESLFIPSFRVFPIRQDIRIMGAVKETEALLNSNPVSKELIERNPSVKKFLCDPEILQEHFSRSPEKIKIQARMIDNMYAKIENLPDFLSDDQIRLDIENPQVMLHINNFSPATVEINAKIKAYKNNQLTQEIGVGSMYNTAPIYAANGINNICLSTKGYSNSSESNISNVKVDDLSKLLTIIPDRIEITQIETSVLPEYYSIRLGDTYQFNTNYDVDAPLTFGPNLNIVYTDSISDLGSDLEDIEFKEIHALIDATNNIPLQLGLDAKPYDKNGQEITDVDVTINGNIMAGSMTNGQNSHLEIIIKSKTNSPIKGLDKILLQLTGTVPENMGYQTLNKNQTIKFDNIRLKVIDGVTIDLN